MGLSHLPFLKFPRGSRHQRAGGGRREAGAGGAGGRRGAGAQGARARGHRGLPLPVGGAGAARGGRHVLRQRAAAPTPGPPAAGDASQGRGVGLGREPRERGPVLRGGLHHLGQAQDHQPLLGPAPTTQCTPNNYDPAGEEKRPIVEGAETGVPPAGPGGLREPRPGPTGRMQLCKGTPGKGIRRRRGWGGTAAAEGLARVGPGPLARPRRKGRRSKPAQQTGAASGRQCLPASNGTIEICRTSLEDCLRWAGLPVARSPSPLRCPSEWSSRRAETSGSRPSLHPPRLAPSHRASLPGSLLKGLSLALSSRLGNSLCCLLERKTQSCSRWATCAFLQLPMAQIRARVCL